MSPTVSSTSGRSNRSVPGDETVIYGIERLNRVTCNSPGNLGTCAKSTRNPHISIRRK